MPAQFPDPVLEAPEALAAAATAAPRELEPEVRHGAGRAERHAALAQFHHLLAAAHLNEHAAHFIPQRCSMPNQCWTSSHQARLIACHWISKSPLVR